MKLSYSLVSLMSTALLTWIPLSASSSYDITETEISSASNPLGLFSNKTTGQKTAETVHNIPRKKRLPLQGSKTLYLTFDDGPGKGTANVLRVLSEEGVEATMFFIGRNIEHHRSLYNQALSMPNLLIANHTYSHANGKYEQFYNSTVTVVNDIDRAQRIIGGAKYLRLAGRNVWRLPDVYRNDYALSKTRRLIESPKYTALSNRGYQIYGWDIEWHFDHVSGNASYGADQMANRIETLYQTQRLVKTGKMVLLAHDPMFKGAAGAGKLRELVQILKASGWQFETLSSYEYSTPAVFVRKKPSVKKKKVIRIAMRKKDPVLEQVKKQKRLLLMLR